MPRKKYWKKARKRFKGKVFRGSFSQSDERFCESTAGKQCMTNCFVALIRNAVKNVCTWDTNDLDEMLMEGDRLYMDIQQELNFQNDYLLVTELPLCYEMLSTNFTVTYGEPLAGLLGTEAINLEDSLSTVLESGQCFITFCSNTMAIIKNESSYFIYDPHSRDVAGMIDANGTSIVMEFQKLTNVVKHITNLHASISLKSFMNDQFEVTPVTVLESYNLSPTPEKIQVTEATLQSMKFDRLRFEFKRYVCEELDLTSDMPLDLTLSHKELNTPDKIYYIKEDGNCFFRALSKELSDTESNHIRLRDLITANIENRHSYFESFLEDVYADVGVHNYLKMSGMKRNKTWATEMEIFSACDLLGVDIYTYIEGKWLRYSKMEVSKSDKKAFRGSIYLNCKNKNHYDVVLGVLAKTENSTIRIDLKTSNEMSDRDRKKYQEKRNEKLKRAKQRYQQKKNEILWERRERYRTSWSYRQKMKTYSRIRYQEKVKSRHKAKSLLGKTENSTIRIDLKTSNKMSKKKKERKRYQEKRSEIRRRAKQRYQENKSEIRKRAKQRYQQRRREILKKAKQRYQQKRSEILRTAKQKYQQKRSEILKDRRERYRSSWSYRQKVIAYQRTKYHERVESRHKQNHAL